MYNFIVARTEVVIQISVQSDTGERVKLSLQDFTYANTDTNMASYLKTCNKYIC